ncbi:MAG TPA: hypothetical protein P5121_16735 [Caldilineaceae bacterium]|nr:hypothetical protein [Caldilineaceae bacterium]
MPAVRVVIYGASLILAAIEAGLKEWPNFTITHIDPNLPLAVEQIRVLQPQVVIVDGRHDDSGICPSLILRVDRMANNQAAVFNNQSYPITHIDELVDVIIRFISARLS